MNTPTKTHGSWLRYVPPAAALGTAFVLQVIIVTDTLGGALAKTDLGRAGWLFGVLFGLSVASCAEGGAAYLMDLYDRHLLARDSVWLLRLAMLVYVAGSAAVIHWWADRHHLPAALSVLLAGMSASALFLWSRGARWRNREAMRTAGQIDPALPRLPVSAKVLHPVRWLTTLYLISWSPVATTDQARERWTQWHDRRTGRTAATGQYVQSLVDEANTEVEALRAEAREFVAAARRDAEALLSAARDEADRLLAAARRDADRTAAGTARRTAASAPAVQPPGQGNGQRPKRTADSGQARRPDSAPTTTGQPGVQRGQVSVEQLADTLELRSPDSIPGRPTAITILREAHGSCSGERAKAAIELLSARRNGHRETDSADQERLPERINGHTPELIGATTS